MESKIFISYSSKYNKSIAGEIKRFFEEYKDITCFAAHDDIKPGSKWEEEILNNLNSANFFMPIHTKHLEASYWCQQEAGYALAKNIKIVPLIPDVDGTDPVGFYAKFQGHKIKVDDLQNSVKLWLIKEGIVKTYNVAEIDKRIYLFSKSDSFDEAARTANLILEFKDELSDPDILRIIDIALNTYQIRNSFLARDLLVPFFKKHADIITIEKLKEIIEKFAK